MRRLIVPIFLTCLIAVSAVIWAEPKVTMTSTVPRAGIDLTIYNPIVSLIQERREVSLAKGINEFRMTWAGVSVNRESVRLVFLDDAQGVQIRDAILPADDPNTVIWHLEAGRPGTYPLALSYYAGGFSWRADYVLTVDDQEKNLWLKAWANITNASGENYQDANIRLVMGDVRILSGGGPRPPQAPGAQAAERAAVASMPASSEEVAFAREGFAEYTFYTLARPETLDSGDTKRVTLASSSAIPLRKVYQFDPQAFGSNVAMQYWVENKKDYGLGPMPPGLVRAYRQEKDGRLSLLGEDMLPYVPLAETAKIYLGNAHNIVVETAQIDYQRTDEQWAPDKSRVTRYVEEAEYKVTVKNRKANAVELIVRQYIPTDAKLVRADPQPEQPRLGTLEWKLQIGAGEARELTYRTSRTVYNQ
jgi:hypothetical protein